MKRQHQAARSRASPDVRLPIMIELITPFINFKSLVYEELLVLPFPGQVLIGRCASRQASPVKKLSYEKIITFFDCYAGWGGVEPPWFLDTLLRGCLLFEKSKHLNTFVY